MLFLIYHISHWLTVNNKTVCLPREQEVRPQPDPGRTHQLIIFVNCVLLLSVLENKCSDLTNVLLSSIYTQGDPCTLANAENTQNSLITHILLIVVTVIIIITRISISNSKLNYTTNICRKAYIYYLHIQVPPLQPCDTTLPRHFHYFLFV